MSFIENHDCSDGKIDSEGTFTELIQQGALKQLLEECEREEKERKKGGTESEDELMGGKQKK